MAACVLFASNGDVGASRFKRGLVNLADFLPLRNRRLSLTLAELSGVSERIFHAVPDLARNFDTVSARP
jgi:hypothetical protein